MSTKNLTARRRVAIKRSKAVTIGIGIKLDNAILIASDTQITYGGSHKFHECKIYEIPLPNSGWACFTFAGDPELMKMFRDRFISRRDSCRESFNLESTKDLVADTLEEMESIISGSEYGLDMLFGFSLQDKMALFKSTRMTIREVPFYDYVGVGDSSVLRYLALILLSDREISIEAGSAISVYMIARAKAFIDGCGGDTNLIQLLPRGQLRECSGTVPSTEQAVLLSEFYLKQYLLDLSNPKIGENEKETARKRFSDSVSRL